MDIFRFLLKSSRRLFLTTFAVTCAGGIGMIAVLLMLRVFLRQPADDDETLIWIFCGLGLFAVSARVIGPALQGALSRTDLSKIVARLSRRLLAAPLPLLERLGNRHLQLLFLEDASSASQTMRALALLSANVLILAVCLTVLWFLSGWLFLFAVIIATLDLGSQCLLWPQMRRRADIARKDQLELHGAFSDLVGGVGELKMHHLKREAFLQEILRPALGSQARAERGESTGGAPASGGWLVMVFGGIVRLLFFATIGIVLIGFPRWGMASWAETTGYVILFIFSMQPLEGIKLPLRLLSRAVGALRRIDEFERAAEPPETEAELLGNWPGSDWKQIAFVGIEYRGAVDENKSPPCAFGPIDAELGRGELLVIRGEPASGKNTFAKLVAGLVAPDAGSIQVDGEVVTPELRENYRQLFSIALGDPHLFYSPWGLDWLKPKGSISRCAELLGVDRLMEWKEGRLVFPHPPASLSETEKRRLALFGAIIEDRPILVCDEGVAGSDPGFRHAFYERIIKALLARGKSVVVVARQSEIPIDHRVIELDSPGANNPTLATREKIGGL